MPSPRPDLQLAVQRVRHIPDLDHLGHVIDAAQQGDSGLGLDAKAGDYDVSRHRGVYSCGFMIRAALGHYRIVRPVGRACAVAALNHPNFITIY